VKTGYFSFIDRRDAGFELGKLLETKYKNSNVLVLGIPRGGVEVAYDVAKILDAQLSVVISKKIPHPDQEEFAIGAVAEDGSVFLTQVGKAINESVLRQIILRQLSEIQSRIRRFRNNEPLPDMKDHIVIILDDGIATGSTMVPVVRLCKNRSATKVIVAAPVSGPKFAPEIIDLADELVVAEQPEEFYAVAQVYRDFHELNDEKVLWLLNN